ncbi:hypothetical protein D3C84_1298960 [compost metagenome]
MVSCRLNAFLVLPMLVLYCSSIALCWPSCSKRPAPIGSSAAVLMRVRLLASLLVAMALLKLRW